MNRLNMLDPGLAARAALIVRNRTGLVFDGARRSMFEAGLSKGVQRTGGKPVEYVERLAVDNRLLDELVIDVTIGETYFFRDENQFAVIRERILPAFTDIAREHPVRVWSAGCATGEEAYSLAIAMREAGVPGRVLGSDISRKALAIARRACFREWSLRGVPDTIVRRYFRRVREQYELDPDIRSAVDFQYFNLAAPLATWRARGVCEMDLILCRNVLIYFDAETVERVAVGLLDALSPDGWLLTGASDPPLQRIVSCEVVTIDGVQVYRRRKQRAHVAAGKVSGNPEKTLPSAVERSIVRRAARPSLRLTRRSRPEGVRPPQRELTRPRISNATAAAAEPVSADELAALYAAHRFDEAAALARSRIDLNASDLAAWIILVRSEANAGRLQLADAMCLAALEHHPLDAELEYLHGVLIMEAGRADEAAEAFRRAIYLNRSLVLAHISLAQVLSRAGRQDAARRAFMNAEHLLASMDPDSTVPASDGEKAGHLLALIRAQAALSHAS